MIPAFQGSADSIAYSNRWSRERRDMLTEKAASAVAAALAQGAPNGAAVENGGPALTHPAQSANREKSAK